MLNLTKCLRTLAKSIKYQTIYGHDKNGISLTLFKNKGDYTDIQLSFLRYLAYYSNLFMDIGMDEIGEIVIDNFTYEDAYSYYKDKQDKKTRRDRKKETEKHEKKAKESANKGKPKTKSDMRSKVLFKESKWVFKPRDKSLKRK